ncbi:ferrous iron transport protein B [Ruminococcaceae bacterium YRB3002]|nr:ferrous iron transport protein B [Ruminococcaceae bacterium YRB3002]
MNIRIALAGNPNCGKTTLFNALTGSNQFVGNWPGVTVEKKEGKLKKHDGVTVTDLPGIYSLSPYTLEEVVARNYLIDEKPDVILNIVDGTNLERNLYLTTQLTELGIPVVMAVNMMDLVEKNGDKIDLAELGKQMGCKAVSISALKGTGINEAAEEAIKAAEGTKTVPPHTFSGPVEHALAHIEEAVLHDMDDDKQRWYAIKIFERDEKIIEKLAISKEKMEHIEKDIAAAEKELDDDAESIITNERYVYIASIIKTCYKKKSKVSATTSDKIDKIVTNRFLALPIFAVIMWLVYYIAMITLGTGATDWTNDGLFGDGWYLFGIGQSKYDEQVDEWAGESVFVDEVKAVIDSAVEADIAGADNLQGDFEEADFGAFEEDFGFYADEFDEKGFDLAGALTASGALDEEGEFTSPDPAEVEGGVWVPSIPDLATAGLEKIGANEFVTGLVVDGIIGGVGAVLGFVPQMLVLFFLLAFLESCGYMARVAFVLDRIFRRFGLSGKSFIPMLVASGCGVPGIMASRTIESQRDRRMTIMTATFIPCGAKLPIIALITAALFRHTLWRGGWIAPCTYFIGVAAVIVSGVMLKKTKMFAGDPAPFVMELPAYHWPTLGNLLRSMWERGWSFIKKAGTVILISSIVIWLGKVFGNTGDGFGFDPDMELEASVLGMIGNALKWVFAPIGFANIKATIATIMGLVAKEEVVGVFGVLDFEGLTPLAGFSFLIFNLLCAPCFAAIGAIKREMNSAKWTWFAIGYQCVFAYAVSLIVYQTGLLFAGSVNVIGLIAAIVVLAGLIYLLVRPAKKEALK